MNRFALLLFALTAVSVCLAQAQLPASPTNAPTQTILIGCVPKHQQSQPLRLENLSVKGITGTSLVPLGDGGFDYAVVYDRSGSMGDWTDAQQFVLHFVFTNLVPQPKSRGLIVIASDKQPIVAVPISDQEKTEVWFGKTEAKGRTPLFDAMLAAVEALRKLPDDSPRLMFLFSDGGDNISKTRFETVERGVLQSRVRLIVVDPSRLFITAEETDGKVALRLLAERSGGFYFQLGANNTGMKQLRELFQHWYLLEVAILAPASVVGFHLRTNADCKLVAPSRLYIAPRP